MNQEGYCVLCNRDRPKGTWKKITFEVTKQEVVLTSRGKREIKQGLCPVCNARITHCKAIK